MLRKTGQLAGITVLALGLAACGASRTDRAISGAGLGAAAGGVGAAVIDGDIGAGVIVGGLLGGATGALTDERDINLGDPVWRRERY